MDSNCNGNILRSEIKMLEELKNAEHFEEVDKN